MKKTTLILISTTLFTLGTIAQNTVCLTIETNPNPSDPALSVFSKYVNVLDCFSIYAESSLSDAQVLHAAAVAAELLDNDEDGVVDDSAIKTQLTSSGALMPLFGTDGNAASNTFMNNYNGNGVSAVLYAQEIDPTQPGHWGYDATVEEILHTINHVGHTNIYPSAFSIAPNSSLMSNAMDVARGGQFTTIPTTYPSAAWYHYDDATCNYECMAIEYMYWSIVSYMGILDDTQTCLGIANEWEACSPSLFQAMDTVMYNLITDPQYKLPLLAPDGNYCISSTSVASKELDIKIGLYPNPAIQKATLTLSTWPAEIVISDTSGKILVLETINTNKFELDLTELSGGLYFYSVSSGGEQVKGKLIVN